MAYTFMIDFFLRLVEPLFPYTFDPLLTPLLGMGGPLTGARLTILVVSVALAGMLTGLRYLLIDMDKYERLKEKREEMQERMQEAQDDADPGEMGDHMQEMMDHFFEMQKVMIKPLLASMVIFFLILPWMYTTFIPIVPMEQTGDGAYSGDFQYNGVTMPLSVTENSEPTVVVDGEEYSTGDVFHMDGLPWKVKSIDTADGDATVKVAAIIIELPFSLPFIGNDLGWLGTYILVIMPFSFMFQRWIGLH